MKLLNRKAAPIPKHHPIANICRTSGVWRVATLLEPTQKPARTSQPTVSSCVLVRSSGSVQVHSASRKHIALRVCPSRSIIEQRIRTEPLFRIGDRKFDKWAGDVLTNKGRSLDEYGPEFGLRSMKIELARRTRGEYRARIAAWPPAA